MRSLLVTVSMLLVAKSYSADPCKTMKCAKGTFCVSVKPNCANPPCARIASCVTSVVEVVCPKLNCPACPAHQIRRRDHAGCEICACHDPCEGIKCPANHDCVAVETNGRVGAACLGKLTCHAWGDPHYITFDKAEIHYYGVGEYAMSELSLRPGCQQLPDFQLLVEQEHRFGSTRVSYIKFVTLILPGKVEIKISRNRLLSVDGAPFTVGDPLPSGIASIEVSVVKKHRQLHLSRDISVIRIETSFGVIVEYDGNMWASVIIPHIYSNCVEGLCGNADMVKKNDFQTRQGADVSGFPAKTKFWAIGNSWHVTAKNSSPRNRRATHRAAARREIAPLTGHEQTEDKMDLSCDNNIMKIVDSVEYCGSLLNKAGSFADCMVKSTDLAKNIYEGCKIDVCANKHNLRVAKYLAQSSVGTFVSVCAGDGLLAERKVLPTCPGNLVWMRCGRKCTRTCGRPYCRQYQCVEKCSCPRRRPFQQGNECFSYRQCVAAGLWRR